MQLTRDKQGVTFVFRVKKDQQMEHEKEGYKAYGVRGNRTIEYEDDGTKVVTYNLYNI